jgi:3-hydroxyacyl-[acyl-carrier-protein] dehydratase
MSLESNQTKTESHPLYKDLYHRSPYLLIDDVLREDQSEIVTVKKLIGDEFYFQGHFPHAPVLPGAMMQEMTTQSAGVLIARFHNPVESYDTENFDPGRLALGVLSRIKEAKYKTFAKPGDRLEITVKLVERLEHAFEFTAVIKKFSDSDTEGSLVMKNRFVLTNIPSAHLMS